MGPFRHCCFGATLDSTQGLLLAQLRDQGSQWGPRDLGQLQARQESYLLYYCSGPRKQDIECPLWARNCYTLKLNRKLTHKKTIIAFITFISLIDNIIATKEVHRAGQIVLDARRLLAPPLGTPVQCMYWTTNIGSTRGNLKLNLLKSSFS